MKKGKYLAKKLCAVALAAGMMTGICMPISAADNSYIKGTFTFGPHISKNDRTDEFTYTDQFFRESAYETNLHLAIVSMQMAAASISSEDADYPEKSKNIQDFLTKLGFQNVEVNQAYKEKMKKNSMGAAVAYKDLGDSVLLAIVPRSAGYEAEWGGNFTLGESGLHEGFRIGRDNVLSFAKNYVSSHASAFEGKTVKVWTAGYSRGAAVANLTGAALVDDSNSYLGLEVKPEDIYDYTFGTPLNVPASMNPRAEKYNNIHNYYADYDPVTMVAPKALGFDRYGKDELLDVHTSSTKTKMLEYLKNLNPDVYQAYTTSDDPDQFEAKTFGENFSIVTDTQRTLTQKDFLTERIRYLVGTTIPDRESYAKIYESGVSEAAVLLIGGEDDTVAAFTNGASASSSLKPLAVMLFAYNWADQYVKNKGENTPVTDGWEDEVLPDPDTEISAGTDKNLNLTKDFLESDTYQEVYDEFTSDDLSVKYQTDLTTYGDLLKIYQKIAGAYMHNVLSDGLAATGLTGDSLTGHVLLQGNNPEALSVVAAQMLFGTRDTLGITAIANKLNNAATFVGNSSYMRVHNNEVILSWLRAMDNEPWESEKEPEKQPLTYAITGADTWTKGSKEGLELKASAGTITGIKIDGQETKADQYSIASDARSITLGAGLLETMTTGKHSVTVMFSDGTGSHDFQIIEAAKQDPKQDPKQDTKPEEQAKKIQKTVKKGPKTGDTANIPLWGMLAVLSGTAVIFITENKRRKKGN